MENKIKEKLVSPVLMWIIVFIGIIISIKFLPDKKIFELGFIGTLIFAFSLIYWFYFFINSIVIHRQAPLSVAKIERIVKEGVYKKIRHPIYSSDIILGWGIFFLLPKLNVFIAIIWFSAVLVLWMFLEEKSLVKKFGGEYINYKKEVPMFFPFCKKQTDKLAL